MVAKINVGSSLFGALSYNQEKIDKGEGKIVCSNKVLLPIDGSLNRSFCLRSFENHMPKDIKTEKPVIHISLNPHPNDKLSDEELTAIAQEYLEKLGYGDQPYMVYKHEDIDRHHIHIVSLRVDEKGRKIDDKFEFKRSKDITRELEKKYGLLPAEKQYNIKPPQPQKINYKGDDVKKQIANLTKALASSYRFQSIGEYKTLLSLYNIGLEEVKGEFEGKAYHGIVYFALDKGGRKKGNPIKSSIISKKVGADALKRRCGINVGAIKKQGLKVQTKELVSATLKTAKNKKLFVRELQKQGIDLVFRENKDGRIYGVTFIDHGQRTVLNGSRLGKEFSANVLNEQFGQGKPQQNENTQDKDTGEEKGTQSMLFSFLDFESQGENYEEEIFIRKMKRKKRRKRKS